MCKTVKARHTSDSKGQAQVRQSRPDTYKTVEASHIHIRQSRPDTYKTVKARVGDGSQVCYSRTVSGYLYGIPVHCRGRTVRS